MATHRKISAEDLKEMRDQGTDTVLINTLPEAKFAEGHVPGSENVPGDAPNFAQEVERLAGSKGRHIVVYCGGGKSSALAAVALEEAGFTSVEHFEGGMTEWNQLGYPVETGLHTESRR